VAKTVLKVQANDLQALCKSVLLFAIVR